MDTAKSLFKTIIETIRKSQEGGCMKKKRELSNFLFLIEKIRKIVDSKPDKDGKLKAICKLLRDNISHYDWVGFYLTDKARKNELILGPFEGEPTEHVGIPFGRGICGQAAELRKTFIVQDVSKELNYLSCSPKVKSEIVIPIFKNGEIVGELDIDSHTLSPFTDEDREFLEKVCEMVSKLL
ncbi:MAG: GAF domain-containing protein [Candidatus Bathyarchaeota archaeon]|nr:GAF domain-containing protein [Candidatus Bathyarchaeota archaeon]